MDISKKIQNRRIELGMSVDDLAVAIGKNRATVYRYENQEIGKLPVDILKPLASALGVSPAYLMGWEEEATPAEDKQSRAFADAILIEMPESVLIPVYGKIKAGVPLEAIEDVEEHIDVPAKWIQSGRKIIGLKVDGDSMYPRYFPGDIVVIECNIDCYSGDDCAVYVNGYEATIKQIKWVNDGIELIPVNTIYAPQRYKNGDYSILGKVIEMRRRF